MMQKVSDDFFQTNQSVVVRSESFRIVISALCQSSRRNFELAIELLNRMRDLELPTDAHCLASIQGSSHCTEQIQKSLPVAVSSQQFKQI
jgi:hypothetical protein